MRLLPNILTGLAAIQIKFGNFNSFFGTRPYGEK